MRADADADKSNVHRHPRRNNKTLRIDEIGRVAVWSDIGISHAFEIVTKVKSDKVYKFSARLAIPPASRESWRWAQERACAEHTASRPVKAERA